MILKKKPGPTYPQVDDVFEVQRGTMDPDMKEGEVLIETLYLSIDAAMRVWITGYIISKILVLRHTLTLSYQGMLCRL